MPDDATGPHHRRSRFWLFAPSVLLALVAAGWTTAWFMIRNETSRSLDAWMAAEASSGRQWTCPNRAVGGYPFRIEVTCDALVLQRPDARMTLGAVTAVAQVYQPRHIIAEITGPLRVADGPVGVEATWRQLEASVRVAPEGLQRISIVVDAPEVRVSGLGPSDVSLRGERLETHLRPDPNRPPGEGAYDWSLSASKAAIPFLDLLVGGTEPADLDLQLTATQARDAAARPIPEELERWRGAGGRIDITALSLRKGRRRLEARGDFGLDEAHRPEGQANLSAIGLEGLVGAFAGERSSATSALIGALTGRAPTRPEQPASPPGDRAGQPGLKPLPPLRLAGGRLLLGTLTIPGVRIPPLY